jgi:uncharacterized protein YecE (DUF72 family)
MLRMGTCSWKFPSWDGLVYSSPHPPDYLAEYAHTYRTVEIDQWFWSLFGPDTVSLPGVETAHRYAGVVDSDFRFTIKAPNSVTLTHVYKTARKHAGEPNPHFLSAELFTAFLNRISVLQSQCDAIMLQFEYLNRAKMPSASEFRRRIDGFLASAPDGWPLAVEIRNPNYFTDEWFALLAGHGTAHVFNQGYFMPPVVEVYRRFGSQLVPRSVIRLLGPDRSGIEQQTGKRWDRRVAPKDAELSEIAAMTRELLDREFEVTVNVNNHYEGSAPRTIAALRSFLEPGS